MKLKYILPEFFQRFVWMPLRVLMIVFCSLEVNGAENVKKIKNNVIFAANHISEMDPLLLVSVLPFFSRHFPIIYVSLSNYSYKSSKWKQFLYGGILFSIIGGYPAYKGFKNYEVALPHHLEALNNNKNVGIFPYGCVVRDRKNVKARGGATFLANKINVPIMPVKIVGTDDFTIQNILSGKKKIIFTFGKPIYPKNIFKNPKKAIINKRRNDYEIAAKKVMDFIERL